jgi:hypothetical protein
MGWPNFGRFFHNEICHLDVEDVSESKVDETYENLLFQSRLPLGVFYTFFSFMDRPVWII